MTVKDVKIDVESPFQELNIPIVDMTKHTKITGPALRVELRRVKAPVILSDDPARVVESGFVIGLILETDLPCNGKSFRMPYHLVSNNTGFGHGHVIDYGHVNSVELLKGVIKIDSIYYFETNEGAWRLEILDKGN